MLLFRKAVLLLSLPLLVACAATAPATRAQTPADTTRKGGPEDLTRYRPVFAPLAAAGAIPTPLPAAKPSAPPVKAAPTPTNQVNAQVEQRLRDQAFANQNVKYASGYRVRAYLGLEREQVMSIRRQIIARYPEETDYITFKQPVYRLYVGDYITKLDAARGLAKVREFAPRAELEPMQVLLDKTP